MLKLSPRLVPLRALTLAGLLGALWTSQADASPVLLAGSGTEKVHSTDIVLMEKDGKSVVTILNDYQGPLSGFAVIIPVPADVTPDHVATLKREFVDRVATVSAPKFAEFWEMDPCDPDKLEQDWERDMTAKAETAFMGSVQTEPGKKVAKELLLDVEAKTKDGEFKETFIGGAQQLQDWLKKKEYELPAGGAENLTTYEAAGYKFLALDVDVDRIELVGGDRAMLSPIRFWTGQEIKSLPTRFGLPSAAKQQELEIYTMIPDQRMQVTNYDTKAAPTNLRVVTEYAAKTDGSFNLKEKMGEFYGALHDRFLEKHPNTFLLEYAFGTDTCGQPCSTEPLLPHEILSLGADVFEKDLPESERRPEPPEATEAETQSLEATLAEKKTPKEKKEAKQEWEDQRKELAARKAMLARNTFVLSRLHYRYDKSQMPKDVELGPGGAISGGVALPEGEHGAADTSVKPSEKNEFQSRYNGLFPNKIVVKCDNPKPYRWGKAPRSYRGLRKIWVAEDLSRRNRTRVAVEDAVMTPVPDLGIAGKLTEVVEAPPAPAAAEPEKKEGGCGCSAAGLPIHNPTMWGGGLLLGLSLLRRRKQKR